MISTISHLAISVTDQSQVGEARRALKLVTDRLALPDEIAGRLAIIVTEAATNLVQHAKDGQVLICPYVLEHGECGVDVIAIDRGPGIYDVSRSLGDGFSTAGTAGNGLGAIQRLSDEFEIYSLPGSGTALLARVRSRAATASRAFQPAALKAGFVCVPIRGEQVSGDTVAVRISSQGGTFMVADGLGHGIAANEASLQAARIFSEERDATPANVVDSLHHGLRSTRGAAVGVAAISCESRTVRYSGVGNIAGTIMQGDVTRSLISHNGIVGHQSHRVQEFTYQWPTPAVLVMNSDGLHTNWKLSQYPGLLNKDPALIAAVLYRDFSRGRDDVAILVVKEVVNA